MEKTNRKNGVITHNIYDRHTKSETRPLSISERLALAIKDKTYSVSPRKLDNAAHKSAFVGVRRNPMTEFVSWMMHDTVREAVTAYARSGSLEESDFLWKTVYKSEAANIKLSLEPLLGNETGEILGFICEKKSDIRKEFDTDRIAGKNKEIVLNRMAAQVAEVEKWVNDFANSIAAIDVGFYYKEEQDEDLVKDECGADVECNNVKEFDSSLNQSFVVTVSERSLAYISVKASSRQEAIDMVATQYDNGEVMFEHYEDFSITAKHAETP